PQLHVFMFSQSFDVDVVPGGIQYESLLDRAKQGCNSQENFNVFVSDSGVISSEAGSSATATLVVNASATNQDPLEIILEVQQNGTGGNSTYSAIKTSIGNNDFLVSPGEKSSVPITFSTSADAGLGSYSYRIAAVAKDIKHCNIEAAPAFLTLQI